MAKTILAVWALLVTSAVSGPALATVLDQLKEDFKPTSGYIIMPAGDEYLIDQDATTGARTGDLYTVVQKGEKIIHPVTQEVLGTLDEVKGLLQVTRVKTGYSYVRPVGETATLERGEVVRRYDHVPATFWDYTGQGEGFFNELKAALPALDWRPYADAQAGRPPVPSPETAEGRPLVFVLKRDGLTVHGPEFVGLKNYPPPVSIEAAAAPVTRIPPPAPAPAGPAPAVPVPAPVGVKAEAPATAQPTPPATGPVVYPDFQLVGPLPDTALMADFVQGPEGLLLAATDGQSIRVYRVTGETLIPLAAGRPENPATIKTLAWWQPAGDESLYLAATVAVDVNEPYSPAQARTVMGMIFLLQGSSLEPVKGDLSYILGTFDLDDDGKRETLLGQPFDRENFFGMSVRKLSLVDGQVEKDSFGVELPWQFPVAGGHLADITGDGKKEAIFVRNQVLFIYQGRKKLYESSKNMGGSVSSMSYSIYPGTGAELLTTIPFEVPPHSLDLDGDGHKEIIAITSDGSSFRAPGLGPGIESAGLVAIKYQNGVFQKGTIGDRQESPIQGLAKADNGFYLVVTQSPNMLGVSGNSRLLLLPVSRP